MKTIVDNKSGMMMLVPENDKDHRLIFHLINCCELSEFSKYLERENDTDKEITESLDVDTDQLMAYPSKTQWQQVDRTPVRLDNRDSSMDGKIIGFKV